MTVEEVWSSLININLVSNIQFFQVYFKLELILSVGKYDTSFVDVSSYFLISCFICFLPSSTFSRARFFNIHSLFCFCFFLKPKCDVFVCVMNEKHHYHQPHHCRHYHMLINKTNVSQQEKNNLCRIQTYMEWRFHIKEKNCICNIKQCSCMSMNIFVLSRYIFLYKDFFFFEIFHLHL